MWIQSWPQQTSTLCVRRSLARSNQRGASNNPEWMRDKNFALYLTQYFDPPLPSSTRESSGVALSSTWIIEASHSNASSTGHSAGQQHLIHETLSQLHIVDEILAQKTIEISNDDLWHDRNFRSIFLVKEYLKMYISKYNSKKLEIFHNSPRNYERKNWNTITVFTLMKEVQMLNPKYDPTLKD